jgi:hypothetical protein
LPDFRSSTLGRRAAALPTAPVNLSHSVRVAMLVFTAGDRQSMQ